MKRSALCGWGGVDKGAEGLIRIEFWGMLKYVSMLQNRI